jgi:hypothetical protein
MANKPTVTLTLAGDEDRLTDAFDRVGASSKQMTDKVDDSSKGMHDAGTRLDSLTESADGAEGKFMGFHDVLDGVKGGLETLADPSASLTDKLIGLGQAGADIAGGLASFLLPALQTMWTTLTTTVIPAVWSFTSALLANPITWVVLGVAALIGVLYLLGARWDDVKNVVGTVINWIVDRWTGLMSWFSGVPDWFGRIFGAIGNAISGAFKSVINWIVDRLNWLIDLANKVIYGINVVSPFSDISSIPHVPHMHTGGIAPGMPGQETLAVLQGRERVLSPASSVGQGGGAAIAFSGDTDSAFASAFQYLVQTGVITLQVA